MAKIPRPIWQIMLMASKTKDVPSLTCEECVALLGFIAGEAARGTDLNLIIRTIKRHLSLCPDCRESYLNYLRDLEMLATGRKKEG
jgi:hypothetical protein